MHLYHALALEMSEQPCDRFPGRAYDFSNFLMGESERGALVTIVLCRRRG
jgi:hypothetical protein